MWMYPHHLKKTVAAHRQGYISAARRRCRIRTKMKTERVFYRHALFFYSSHERPKAPYKLARDSICFCSSPTIS